jgi:hypothetical protein
VATLFIFLFFLIQKKVERTFLKLTSFCIFFFELKFIGFLF